MRKAPFLGDPLQKRVQGSSVVPHAGLTRRQRVGRIDHQIALGRFEIDKCVGQVEKVAWSDDACVVKKWICSHS